MKIKKFISLLTATATAITALTGAITVTAISSSISFVAVAADTDTYATQGTCGDNARWILSEDGTLTVLGKGAVTDCTPTFNFADEVTRLVVGEGITQVKNGFTRESLKNLTEIILPSTLEKLNSFAIHYCTGNVYIYSKNISDVTKSNSGFLPLPGSGTVMHIYKDSDTEECFRNLYDYTNEDIVYIEEDRPEEPEPTPADVPELTETSGPSGLSSKWEWNETNKTLTFRGKGTISIANDYKKYDKKTEHIVIEDGITRIYASTGVIIYEAISGAFYGFSELKDIQLPNTLTYIGKLSFYETPLTKIELPEGLEEIDDCAFSHCVNLEDVTFPKSLNRIGDSAFNNCSKLKSINLHEGMSIGGAAFSSCKSLKEIIIPKKVKFLRTVYGVQGMSRQPATFDSCTGLEKIIIEDGSWLGDSWNNEFTKDGVADCFCAGCTSLKTVIIKGDVDYIAQKAFSRCTSLTDIYLYNTGLTTITAKGSTIYAYANPTDPSHWLDSFWAGNNPTFHVIKGSQTEQTLRDAGYLTADNTEYLTDFTALDEKIKEAESLDTSKYTDNSVATLKSAIESGKTVLANENATQEQVDSAVATIENAIKALKSKISPAKPTSAPTTRNPEAVKKDKAAAEKLMQQAKIIKLKVKSKVKKKITVSWKKVKNAVGYQVQVSKKRNFKNKIFNKFTSKKKLIISKKIKSKKTYFVRVRAYATYKDTYGKPQKVYSKWNNKLRKVKVK